MKKKIFGVLLSLFFILLFFVGVPKFLAKVKEITKPLPPINVEIAQTVPKSVADEVVSLIQSKEFKSLSDFVSEEKGLIVKPYYTPELNQGRVLSKDTVYSFFSDVAVRDWGYQDGSGQPLKMTNSQYYDKFIGSHNFIKLGKVSYDSSQVVANTLPLSTVLNDIFNGEKVSYAEYYISGFDPQYDGMDWESLALVFQQINGKWYLVGILHNEWTI